MLGEDDNPLTKGNWLGGDDNHLRNGNLLGEDDTPLIKENLLRIDDNPLENGNLLERIFSHSNIDKQIKEWQELGIVDENFKIEDVFENDLTGSIFLKNTSICRLIQSISRIWNLRF